MRGRSRVQACGLEVFEKEITFRRPSVPGDEVEEGLDRRGRDGACALVKRIPIFPVCSVFSDRVLG